MELELKLDNTNAFLETKPTPEEFMKYKQLNPFPAHSDEQIKVLERELENQRNQIAKANDDVRNLQERARDRRLTPSQFKTMVESLTKEEKGEIEIGFISGNSEAERFAKDIALALHLSGWTVTHMVSTTHIGNTPVGLLILTKDPQMPRVRALLAALMQIDPRTQLKINPNLDRPVKFDVGNKP